MNIDDLTIGQAKELAKIFGGKGPAIAGEDEAPHGAAGQKCIVRTYASGVHFGTVISVENNDGRSRCEIHNARRLWKWHGGLSLSEIAMNGIDQSKSRICVTVPVHYIEDAIEFIPVSDQAAVSIEGAKADDAG